MKKTILWLRGTAETLRQAQYAPLILLFFVIAIWLLPSYQSPPQQKTVSITLSLEQTEVVLEALGKLPYEKSAPVIEAVRSQALQQLYPPPPPQKVDSTATKKQEAPKTKKN